LVGAITESINHAERVAGTVFGANNEMAKLFSPMDLVPDGPQFKDGWAVYPILPKKDRSHFLCDGWVEAYHGTCFMNVASIVQEGFNLPSKEDVLHGGAGGHGTAHVYTNPSLAYAAHPVYASFLKLKDVNCVVQLVFQVLVRNSHRCQGSTLQEKHWPRDLPIDL
jgi:hypothetical protein